MIYTVTLNPSLDYIVHVDNFQLGRINRTAGERIYPGGKGINVSIVLKHLGIDNTALGFLAGFTGEKIQKMIEAQGVTAGFIKVKKGNSRINVKVCSKEESEINGQGPEIMEEDINKLYEKLDCLKKEDMLVLAGSIPKGMSESAYMDIMKYLSDKKIRIVVDAADNLLINVLKYHPFLIKPNHHELGEIFGVELKEKKDVIVYAQKLREMGAENVIVSMAGAGAVFVGNEGSMFESEAPKGNIISSVGAGDSMVAGFIACFLATGDYRKAFQYSVCTGSASAFSGQLATKEEVDAVFHAHTFNF